MDVLSGTIVAQVVLILFLAVFGGVVIWAVRMPQSEAEALGRIPLSFDDVPSGAEQTKCGGDGRG